MTQATHYTILGLPQNASDELIKATYRALTKIYHPDIFQGDKKFATEQLKKINEAYETLSNKGKKQKYDEELNRTAGAPNAEEEYEFENKGSSTESDLYQKIIKEEWDYARTFYPELKASYDELKAYSNQLAFLFQSLLVENKQFEDYKLIKIDLREKFLINKYGNNTDLTDLIRDLVEDGHKDIALRIYQQLKRLGTRSTSRILEKLADDEPKIAVKYREKFKELDIFIPITQEEVRSTFSVKTASADKKPRSRSVDGWLTIGVGSILCLAGIGYLSEATSLGLILFFSGAILIKMGW